VHASRLPSGARLERLGLRARLMERIGKQASGADAPDDFGTFIPGINPRPTLEPGLWSVVPCSVGDLFPVPLVPRSLLYRSLLYRSLPYHSLLYRSLLYRSLLSGSLLLMLLHHLLDVFAEGLAARLSGVEHVAAGVLLYGYAGGVAHDGHLVYGEDRAHEGAA